MAEPMEYSLPPLEQPRKAVPVDTLLLLGATVAALVWANVGTGYGEFWRQPLGLGVGDLSLTKSRVLWVNDLLMAVFFLAVGLELKRELVSGELNSPALAALPAAAALGGMLAPVGIFLLFVSSPQDLRGWAIPMATDIAFALGCVRAYGTRVPAALVAFLTAIAVVDDLGAILVIALLYTAGLSLAWLLAAAALVAGLWLMNRFDVRNPWLYVVVGLPLWLAVLKSGVHATVAGVLVGLAVPASTIGAEAPVVKLEHALQPYVAFVVLPLFALANAGVELDAGAVGQLGSPLSLGIVVGLVAGKLIGITGATWLVVRSGMTALPLGLGWRHVTAAALLAGIGFTMALFIASLAYGAESARFAQAKLAIVFASIVSATAGLLVLRSASRNLRPAAAARAA